MANNCFPTTDECVTYTRESFESLGVSQGDLLSDVLYNIMFKLEELDNWAKTCSTCAQETESQESMDLSTLSAAISSMKADIDNLK